MIALRERFVNTSGVVALPEQEAPASDLALFC